MRLYIQHPKHIHCTYLNKHLLFFNRALPFSNNQLFRMQLVLLPQILYILLYNKMDLYGIQHTSIDDICMATSVWGIV